MLTRLEWVIKWIIIEIITDANTTIRQTLIKGKAPVAIIAGIPM